MLHLLAVPEIFMSRWYLLAVPMEALQILAVLAHRAVSTDAASAENTAEFTIF